jgi:hypothetical protein
MRSKRQDESFMMASDDNVLCEWRCRRLSGIDFSFVSGIDFWFLWAHSAFEVMQSSQNLTSKQSDVEFSISPVVLWLDLHAVNLGGASMHVPSSGLILWSRTYWTRRSQDRGTLLLQNSLLRIAAYEFLSSWTVVIVRIPRHRSLQILK